uniref:Uncharacterized protein n=1 Tax=Oryzias sinensis TaxID=183150 RepID=A0A8C7WWJ4_9TELE
MRPLVLGPTNLHVLYVVLCTPDSNDHQALQLPDNGSHERQVCLSRVGLKKCRTAFPVDRGPRLHWIAANVFKHISLEYYKSTSSLPIHQQPSKEAVELDSLKNVTAWPSTPPLPLTFSWKDSSDPWHSTFTVVIKMYNFQGKPKKSGGDFLLARLHSPSLLPGVAGKVVDYLNRSYSALFPLLWEGNVQVQVILVHSSEAVTVLQQLNRMQPHRIYFQSLFYSGSLTETTTCNVYINATQQQLCNYTDLHTGEQWFCYKPKKLSCDARVTHPKGGFRKEIKPQEEI